jgi:mono/diheme cytochrome c family protein
MRVLVPTPVFLLASIFFLLQTGKSQAQNQSGLQASIQRGNKVYYEQCLSCHQADGTGVPNMNPPLIKTAWILGDRSKLIRLVLNGMSGATEIDGETYHNIMAPHKDLSDQQIADVLTYIRNSFGNKASSVSPALVRSVRATNPK